MKRGWDCKTLAEVCQIQPPKAEVRNRLSETDLVSFVPMEDLCIDEKYFLPTKVRPLAEVAGTYTYFADGDVLLAKITPCFENGKVGVAANLTNGAGFGSSEYIVFRPTDALGKDWLYYFLSRDAFRVEGAERMTGAVGHKRVAKDFIEEYRIPLPARAEQQRIIGILDEAFKGLATVKANAEKNLKSARAIFESELNAIFTRKGEGLDESTLGTEIDILCGFPFKSAQYTKDKTDVRLLRGDNIAQGSLRWDDVKCWPAEDADEYERYALCASDVVLAMDRPWVKAGLKRAQLAPEDLPCLLVQRTARLRGNRNLLNRFLFYLISSNSFTRHILGVQTGIGVPHISAQQIKDFRFFIPPVKAQLNIANQLDALSEETQSLESIYQRKLERLEALKKSLLHHAFTGQL